MNTELKHKIIQLISYGVTENILSPIHKHGYPEIHVILSGSVQYVFENKTYTLSESEVIIIPENIYHSVNYINNATTFTYQTMDSYKKIKTIRLPQEFCKNFHSCIKENKGFMHYITFISDELFENTSADVIPPDYSYIIAEFFSENYNKDIHIEDLAQRLSLCSMQAQRVIKKHTGKTFLENLTFYRMTVARQLMKTLPLNEVASLIGYKSYSGFWKAYQKYKSKTV